MATRIFGQSAIRPLFIDFDAYTDGDEEFKKELIDLMIDNLVELQQAVRIAAQNNDGQLFQKACHKVKATLHMLEDEELLELVEQLKIMVTDASKIALLSEVCTGIIDSLRRESI